MDLKNKFSKQPMHRLLFIYMLTLVFILLIFLSMAIFFVGQYKTTKDTVNENLAFQLDVFKQDIEEQYEVTAMLGNSLSKKSSQIIEDFLKQKNISFNDLNDSVEHIQALQFKLYEILHTDLLKSSSSGAFIILDTTVNTNSSNAKFSKSGIYLKRTAADRTDENVTWFRGDPKIANELEIQAHPKWNLEYDINLLKDYEVVIENAKKSLKTECHITDVFTLRETSDRVIEFMVPIINKNNKVYGVCGFELSE